MTKGNAVRRAARGVRPTKKEMNGRERLLLQRLGLVVERALEGSKQDMTVAAVNAKAVLLAKSVELRRKKPRKYVLRDLRRKAKSEGREFRAAKHQMFHAIAWQTRIEKSLRSL